MRQTQCGLSGMPGTSRPSTAGALFPTVLHVCWWKPTGGQFVVLVRSGAAVCRQSSRVRLLTCTFVAAAAVRLRRVVMRYDCWWVCLQGSHMVWVMLTYHSGAFYNPSS
jgi:hypothetical protein